MNSFDRYKVCHELLEQYKNIQGDFTEFHKKPPDMTIFAYNSYLSTTENLTKQLTDTIKKVCGKKE